MIREKESLITTNRRGRHKTKEHTTITKKKNRAGKKPGNIRIFYTITEKRWENVLKVSTMTVTEFQ